MPLLDIPETALFFLATQSIAMASQAHNQILEREYDQQMQRTCNRPLVTKRIGVDQAERIVMSGVLLSNVIYFSAFPLQASIMANVIYLSYISVYTPAKRVTTANTHFGAVSGSLPPILGYLAAGGSLTLPAVVFGGTVTVLNPIPTGLFLYMLGWQY